MRVLIGGANGFIGAKLVAALKADGAEVFPIVRENPQSGQATINLEERELDTSKLPGDGLNDIDVVVNLAGEPITPFRWSAKKKEAIRGSRVNTTDVLSRSIARADKAPSTFISGSAIGYYGSRAAEELTEESSVGSGFLAEVCEAWEYATEPAKQAGTRVVNVRTGIVLGNGGSLKKQLPIFRLGLGGRLGSGHQWMSWIAIEDEVGALLHAIKTDSISGPCNLASPHPVTNGEFTDILGDILHKPTVMAVPEIALRLAVGPLTTEQVLVASQRVLPTKLLESGFQFTLPSIDETLRSIINSGDETEPSPSK